MKVIVRNTSKIKEIIPYGGIKEIAEMANCSIYTVSRVINGKSNNKKVTDALTKFLKNLNTKKVDLENTVATLQNNN